MNNLAIKSIMGMLNLALIMSLLLFLPATTIQYNYAWYYLAIFFTSVIVITLFIFLHDKQLLESRLHVGPVAEQRKEQKIIQSIASVGFAGTYLLAGFDFHFQWSHVSESMNVVGFLLVIITMLIMFFVFRQNSFLSALIEVSSEQQLISDGLYSIVRHPMYSAAIILFIGTPLALGSYCALATLPVMILVLVFRILDEEKMLKNQLTGYKEYCQKTRYRLFPGVW